MPLYMNRFNLRGLDCKNICGVEFFQLGNFHFFNLSEIFFTDLHIIFPVFSSVANKKIFRKKYGFTGLVFKIDAIDGKKWVKFVAMQQNSKTLIFDINTMESTVELP